MTLGLILLTPSLFSGGQKQQTGDWNDCTLSTHERAVSLVSKMTLKEKLSQMLYQSPAITRFGIPSHNWWNECLHGVARAGEATVFPQAIGMAATWDPDQMSITASIISDEARAKHHEAFRNGERGIYQGLTFWSPNINLFRDPRWGRGQETYGEDPYLTASMAIPFVKGLQGDNPEFRKVDATVKHFAVHSGPEPLRHHFDADCSDRELREYYLYAFEKTIKEAEPAALMGAYNRFRGESCCASPYLFNILRKEWGFKGYVVSDCGAIDDIFFHHKLENSRASASALAVKEGCDLNCGSAYNRLVTAFRKKMISEQEIDRAVIRLMETRIKLGIFAQPGENPYAELPISINDSDKHREMNIKMAKKSMVLMKNNGTLPINSNQVKKIAIVGPAADNIDVLIGNYNGTPSKPVTLAAGIAKAAKERDIETYITEGCSFAQPPAKALTPTSDSYKKISDADLIIYCGGLSPRLEGEEGYMNVNADGFDEGDRTRIELPAIQVKTIETLAKTGKPIIMVMTTGSAISTLSVESKLSALLNVWYPGGEGGTATASILFGESNPSGKLPITFYQSTEDLPDFKNYSLENRTYRHFNGTPLYPFGHGLSYTDFTYQTINIENKDKNMTASISVTNSGKVDGEEVIQMYVSSLDSKESMPIKQLAGYKRIFIQAGETRTVTISLDQRAFEYWDITQGAFKTAAENYQISAGSSSQDIRLTQNLVR